MLITWGVIAAFIYALTTLKHKDVYASIMQQIVADGKTLLDHKRLINTGIYGKLVNTEYHYAFWGTLKHAQNGYWYALQTQTVRNNKSTTSLERTIIGVSIPDTKLQIIINSKLNETINGNDQRMQYVSGVDLKVAGTFNSYFSITVPDHTQTEVLTLLAPDTLEYILTKCANFDIEINGDQLFLYAYRHVPYEESEQLLGIVDGLTQELTLTNKDARHSITSQAQQEGVLPVARSVEGAQTFRGLKFSVRNIVSVLIFSTFTGISLFRMFMPNTTTNFFLPFLMNFVIILVIVGVALYRLVRRTNLEKKYKNEVAFINEEKKKTSK